MTRFNPFHNVNSRYGAPMGRRGTLKEYDGRATLYARHCGGNGYYDRGGAYWGHPRVFAVWTRGGAFCAYVEATSRQEAIEKTAAAAAKGEPSNDR